MSGLFPHNVVEQKEGFVFIVAPADEDDENAVELASQAQSILEDSWQQAPSNLTAEEVRDPEEAELIYADAVQLLEEADFEECAQFLITGVIVIGKLVIVNAIMAGEDIEDEEGDEDDSLEADEDDFA
ncbi:hypothetical protein HOS33_gp008 [Erwinia phage vB_EamM_Y3]|uniref:Uncharacterized protein n=1 Tax=Erwinia phage vB_EamM_Y3 TaxID=1983553 RepID=A0A2H4IAT0_9CAUD|nr:hypothetical protein HOS33_gp008 [Erwinia phage vB_EamM_Y3]ARW58648.1 hypothetical protein Y3_008 [Erwinia phage vB_EamM_Y3]QZE55866.1 hypothetical protein pEaSNUABM52_00008 [Erwinia phage pEp_SNUABM_52]